jgi:hypothetical protein
MESLPDHLEQFMAEAPVFLKLHRPQPTFVCRFLVLEVSLACALRTCRLWIVPI